MIVMDTVLKNLHRLHRQGGFTLVEMIVSLGLFTVLVLSATGALLSMMDANRKATAVRSSMDGVNFALDDMSRNIRTGWNYTCISAEDTNISLFTPSTALAAGGTTPCASGIKVETSVGTMEYYFNPPSGATFGVIDKGFRDNASPGSPYAAIPLTPADVNVTKAVFYVMGNGCVSSLATPCSPTDQPRVFIYITGTSGGKQQLKSTFQLQTLAASRVPGGQN